MRAIRRHHYRRLQKKRRHYRTVVYAYDPEYIEHYPENARRRRGQAADTVVINKRIKDCEGSHPAIRRADLNFREGLRAAGF